MKKSMVFIIAVELCFLFFSTGNGAEKKGNSCVNCHGNLPNNTFIGNRYAGWRASLHAKEGITCERCHEGNPQSHQKKAAHTNVYNSGNPLSKVYFKKVPETCGACHWPKYNAFRSSAHYDRLAKKGAGPTCVTCHESHATRIITPREIPATCENCHNRRMRLAPHVPAQAQALLLLVNETSFLVRLAGEKAKSGGPSRLEAWQRIARTMETVREEWHTFNLKQLQARLLEIYDQLQAFLTIQ